MSIRIPPEGSDRSAFQPPRALFDLAVAQAWPRALAALAAAPSDRSRAAALVLQAAGLPEPDPFMRPRQPPADTLPHVRQLAELGRTTRDAGVLQWALAVCERHRGLAECKALSPSGLVTLDPDDGRHWLELAAADASQREQALQRAARSRHFGMQPSLGAAVDAATPADMLPYVAMQLLIQAVGVEAALVNHMGWYLLTQGCGPASQHRRDTCTSLADTMFENGQDLRSLSLAVTIGERAGWPAERVAAGKAAQQRLTAALMRDSFEPLKMYSCEAVDTTRRWIRDREQLGERAALEERAAAVSAAAVAPTGSVPGSAARR